MLGLNGYIVWKELKEDANAHMQKVNIYRSILIQRHTNILIYTNEAYC